MNKKIEFTYDGVDYTLEYDRAAVKVMEREGFDIKLLQSKPLTMIDILWQGAFLKNHKKEKLETINKIYDEIPNKSDLNAALTEMFIETYSILIGDSEETDDNSKKFEWKMS